MSIVFSNNFDDIPRAPVALFHIKDSKTLDDVPVRGLRGRNDTFIQTVAIQNAPLQFVQISQGELIDAQGFSKAVVNLRFSSPTASAGIRVLKKDVNGVKSVSHIRTIPATPIQEGEFYIGEEAIFDILGAERVGILIISGAVERIYVAVV